MSQNRRHEARSYIAQNRAANHHYEISDRYEAGIVLKGSEVKSLREGRVDISQAFASIDRGEVWLRQMYIASFFAARAFPHAERGVRKLLLHAREIAQIDRAVSREGYSFIPLDLYFNGGYVKVTMGLGRGKKMHDKRADQIERTLIREALQEVRANRDRQR